MAESQFWMEKERPKTTLIQPTILDTERLDLFAIDMSQIRCKDLQRLMRPVPTSNKLVNTKNINNNMPSKNYNYYVHINRSTSTLTSCTIVANSCGKSDERFNRHLPLRNTNKISDDQRRDNNSQISPPFLICPICGKKFGSASLRIHQPQCQQKQTRELGKPMENERPSKKDIHPLHGDTIHRQRQAEKVEIKSLFQPSICYICGRKFGSQSIKIHQPQCLQKWHWNNDKLPINLLKLEPTKIALD